MRNSFTTSLMMILPLAFALLLAGVLSWYGDHAVLTADLCLVLYLTGIITGILTLFAMYRIASLAAQNADETPQQPVIIGKNVNIIRICLLVILLACALAFGYTLMIDYSQFLGRTSMIYTFGFVFGLLFTGLTFEFGSACGELKKLLGR